MFDGEVRVCSNELCKKEFVAKVYNTIYCSTDCRKVVTNKKLLDNYYRKKENKTRKRVCVTDGCTTILSSYNEEEILKNAKILWNRSNERVEEKDAVFFNKIQPYIHHSNIPKEGIYCYSFALSPEKWQPTGYYNPGGKFPINTSITFEINENVKDKVFYVDVYVLQYNIFEIIGGMGGFKFS